MLHLLASLALVAATLIAARRFGIQRVALPACVPLLLSMIGPLQWVLVSGLAPAPIVGLLAAIQVERGRPYGEIIAAACLPGLALALMLMFTLDGSADQRRELGEQVSQSLAGMGAESPEPEQLQQLIEMMLALFPGMAFLSMLFVAVAGYKIACGVGQRLQMNVPPPTPMRQWRLWDGMIWGLIGALGFVLVLEGSWRTLGANVLVVMTALFAVQGLALVRHALWRLGIQRFLEIVIYGLLMFTSGISFVVLGLLGLMDTWFDWRRLGHARGDAAAGDEEQ